MPDGGNGFRFAAIDFETATLARDSACSVGVAFVREDGRIDLRRRLIRPPTREFRFTHIHGLGWHDVRSAPTFAAVWRDLAPLVTNVRFLAAHNAPFDRGVLRACCGTYGLDRPDRPFVCTVGVARSVRNIRPTKLSNVCRELGMALRHHEAGSDAPARARIILAAERHGWEPAWPPESIPLN